MAADKSQLHAKIRAFVMKVIVCLLFISPFLFIAGSYAAEPINSIRAAGIANSFGIIRMIEYEKMINDKFSMGARFGLINYDYEDGSYEEKGEGEGADILLRLYPGGNGNSGLYFVSALGYWHVDWEYRDPLAIPSWDYGDTGVLNLNIGAGWKIPMASYKMYIDLAVIMGNYFDLSTSARYDSEPKRGIYFASGLAVGMNF